MNARVFRISALLFTVCTFVVGCGSGGGTPVSPVIGRGGTPTSSPVATSTPSAAPSGTPAASPTPLPTASARSSATPTATPTSTPSPKPTGTPSPKPTATPVPTPVPTASTAPSATPSPKASTNPTPSPTPSPKPSPTATPGPCSQTPPPTSPSATGRLFVSNYGNSSLTVYAPNPNGTLNEAPIATIVGARTQLGYPYDIAVDANGKIYVTNDGLSSLLVYPKNPVGTLDEAPIATIEGSNTGLAQPTGLALDSSGRIYVVNPISGTGDGSVSVFPANPSGTLNEAPTATITGSNTGFAGDNVHPSGVAVDASGKIYVTTVGTPNSIVVFAANPHGTLNEAPLATIAGSKTGLLDPVGIALDASGKIYVTNDTGGGSSTISVYAANPRGTMNEAPLATIVTSTGGGGALANIAVDPSGKIFVANYQVPSITGFAANPSGTLAAAPFTTIAGCNTQLNDPYGITIH